ncbi:MAG: recombination regulator RecX [Nitrosomonadales bacterium]
MKKRPEPSLRERALRYLARREYSRAELAAKLHPFVQVEDDFEQLQAVDLDALLDSLVESDWLSDERAATQLLHARRPRFGLQRITHEMHQKGISEELIEEALPALKDTELETARSVWQRKFGNPPHDAKEKAKQMRFLQSRGFGFDVIFKVLGSSQDQD